jgi:Protein of unknown function (DUF1524)
MVESDSIRTEPPSATRGGGWHPPARSIAPGVPPGGLANKPFREKVKIIEEDLQIRLNSDLLKYSGWGPREIQGRGAELAKLACAIWSPPDADSQNP